MDQAGAGNLTDMLHNGVGVGLLVGAALGANVGASVGANVGAAVGLCVNGTQSSTSSSLFSSFARLRRTFGHPPTSTEFTMTVAFSGIPIAKSASSTAELNAVLRRAKEC